MAKPHVGDLMSISVVLGSALSAKAALDALKAIVNAYQSTPEMPRVAKELLPQIEAAAAMIQGCQEDLNMAMTRVVAAIQQQAEGGEE